MDIFYYLIIFMMGTVFGSFFTLAVYRIPLKKDITHERSFCPNCNHRLEFRDLIPVLSYIFAKGKCRYCGEKIRPRYLILEVTSGLVFLLEFAFLKIVGETDLAVFTQKIAYFVSFVFMYVTIAIIAGIDKEYKKINLGTLLFGIIMQGIYMLYLYIFEDLTYLSAIYRYGMYLVLIIILGLVGMFLNNKYNKSNYTLEIIVFTVYLVLCNGVGVMIISYIVMALLMLFYMACKRIMDFVKKEKFEPKINTGFFLGVATMIVVLIKTCVIYI